MEAGGRLVQDVERAAGRDLRELAGKLDALRLAAGERRRRLAQPMYRGRRRGALQPVLILGMCVEELERLVDGISSTSAIVMPEKRTSSVSRL